MSINSKNIVFAVGDDWEGLYIDGVLQAQNNSLCAREVLRALGVYYDYKEVSDEWLDDLTTLPDSINDVVFCE